MDNHTHQSHNGMTWNFENKESKLSDMVIGELEDEGWLAQASEDEKAERELIAKHNKNNRQVYKDALEHPNL